MKVTRDKTENSQAFLTIELEPAEVEKSLEMSYQRLVKKTNIPGFRKGKAPREIVERYLGRESLLNEALNDLLPQAYEKAVKEQEIEAIAQPHIEIAQTDPLVFKATVPLKPTIKLGDYHSIQITPEPVAITEDDVNSAIEQLRHQQATWEPVERPVDYDDLVVLDIESNIEDKPFINQKGVQYQVRHLPFPGFAEQLVGMKRDEDKQFTLQFPLDYPKPDLAGKKPSFKVKVTEIKQKKLPELNDEFARQISPDFKNLGSLREKVATDLRLSAEEKAKIDYEERVIEAVVDLTQLEFPPILVEREIDRLLNESRRLPMNKTEEELREELRPLATKRVTRSLVLTKIAEEEKIEVSDAEIEAEMEKLTKNTAQNKLQKLHQSIKQILVIRKTIQRLVEIAKGGGKNINARH